MHMENIINIAQRIPDGCIFFHRKHPRRATHVRVFPIVSVPQLRDTNDDSSTYRNQIL